MSVLIMGVSHHTAPLQVLDAVALNAQQAQQLEDRVFASEDVVEAVVLATCNRVEICVDASTFHGAVVAIASALSEVTGVPRDELSPHVAVHYEDRAIAHLLQVACGLDSMAVGESQILGQLRMALARAQEHHHVGTTLNPLLQQALRVGKRAHTETDLDQVSSSLVDAALQRAEASVGDLSAAHVLVVGAGSMSALAATTASRVGVGSLTVINRTQERAERLAAAVTATPRTMDQLVPALAAADVVLSCTGAMEVVVTAEHVRQAHEDRHPRRPHVLIDLALPHDIDPAVASLPGVELVTLDDLGARLADRKIDVSAVHAIVDEEVATYILSRRQLAVAPTVAALRRRAASLVNAELGRLEARLPGVDDHVLNEVRHSVHRVVEKLLHTPTIRVKELAGARGNGDYALALHKLFDLDEFCVASVSEAETVGDADSPPAPVRAADILSTDVTQVVS